MAEKNPTETPNNSASNDAMEGVTLGDAPESSSLEGATSTALMTYAQHADFTNLTQDYKVKIWIRKKNTATSTTLSIAQKGNIKVTGY